MLLRQKTHENALILKLELNDLRCAKFILLFRTLVKLQWQGSWTERPKKLIALSLQLRMMATLVERYYMSPFCVWDNFLRTCIRTPYTIVLLDVLLSLLSGSNVLTINVLTISLPIFLQKITCPQSLKQSWRQLWKNFFMQSQMSRPDKHCLMKGIIN